MRKILCILPGIVGCGVIAHFGMIGTAAMLLLEVLMLVFRKNGKMHDGWMLVFSSMGMVGGYILYPVPVSPPGLGVGVLILTVLAHSALYLMLAGFIKYK